MADLNELLKQNQYFIDLQNRCILTPKEEKEWKEISRQIYVVHKYPQLEEQEKEQERIVEILTAWGNNKQESKNMVGINYGYTLRTYPKASAKKKAEIIRAIY